MSNKIDSTISFAFFGDIMLGGEFIDYADSRELDFLYPFQFIEFLFDNTDLIFINLEGPIFHGPNRRPDVTSILSNDPAIVKFLSKMRLCVSNLANNHIMDYGVEGLNNTLIALQKSGLRYVGAGRDDKEANTELIIEIKGKRVAFLSFTSDEPNVRAILAKPEQAGCASFLDLANVIRRIQNLKKEVDIMCVSLHWGHEYFLYPSDEQVRIAHSLVDAGADYIIGHHPHVLQGVEKYRDALIIYSLGNFFLPAVRSTTGRPQPRKQISKEFMIVKSEITQSKEISFNIIGGNVNEDHVVMLYDGDNERKFNLKIETLSEPLCSPNYNQFWMQYKTRREKELLKESLFEVFRKLRMISFKELIKSFTVNDIERNVIRLYKVLSKSK